MSASEERSADSAAPRGPHTLYLTRTLWDQLERRYLEQRLAGGTQSKIAFLERILWSGLADHASAGEPSSRPPARPDIATPTPNTGTESEPSKPPEVPQPVRVADKSLSLRPGPARPVQRRSSALDRLRQASDPGRPAPIDSAAEIRDSRSAGEGSPAGSPTEGSNASASGTEGGAGRHTVGDD